MLILSRKVNESIIVNENIEIRVTRVDGETVKIGIEAPRDVSIYRKEILESIGRANEEAVLRKPPAESDKNALSRDNLPAPALGALQQLAVDKKIDTVSVP